MPRIRWVGNELDRLKSAYEDAEPWARIQSDFGISSGSLRRIVNQHQLRRRPSSIARRERELQDKLRRLNARVEAIRRLLCKALYERKALRQSGVSLKIHQDKAITERRLEGIRAAWRDPVKREQISVKIALKQRERWAREKANRRSAEAAA